MSKYPEELCAPMRTELVDLGFSELKTVEDVDTLMADKESSIFIVMNSVCGCAAANARPAVDIALKSAAKKPNKLVTVFAGQDPVPTDRLREYLQPWPPTSPGYVMFKGGEIVAFMPRRAVEGRSAQIIAQDLVQLFEQYA